VSEGVKAALVIVLRSLIGHLCFHMQRCLIYIWIHIWPLSDPRLDDLKFKRLVGKNISEMTCVGWDVKP